MTGRLYADDDIFDRRRGVADSGYATSPYIGPLSGLSLNSGYSTADAGSFASTRPGSPPRSWPPRCAPRGCRIARGIGLGNAAEAEARTIAVVRSPSIDALVNNTDVYSNNFFAEMLIKLLGAEFGSGGTTAAGAAVVEDFARGKGTGVHAVDGSGLTRGNRASPRQVVRLLQAMRTSPVGEDFVDDLALSGREGTVATAHAGVRRRGPLPGQDRHPDRGQQPLRLLLQRQRPRMIFSVLMAGVGSLDLAHYEQDRIAAAVAGL